MDHDEFIETLVTTGLDHQRRIDDADSVRVFAFPLAQDLILARDDERMKDVVQTQTLLFVSKNDRRHSHAIECAVRRKYVFTKLPGHRLQPGGPRHYYFACRLVRIQNMTTEFRKHGGDE